VFVAISASAAINAVLRLYRLEAPFADCSTYRDIGRSSRSRSLRVAVTTDSQASEMPAHRDFSIAPLASASSSVGRLLAAKSVRKH
jgi:hypothetical protein